MTIPEMNKITKALEKISEQVDWLSLPSQSMEKQVKDKIHYAINEVADLCQKSVQRETKKGDKK